MLSFRKCDPSIKYLSSTCQQIRQLIDLIGDISIPLRHDYFDSLTRIIISQQLSTTVASTIYRNLNYIIGDINPDSIYKSNLDIIRRAGISKAKASCLLTISENVKCGRLNLDQINAYENEEVISILNSIKGIGRWSAEMFLIFSLGRSDVFSLQDGGLKRSIQWIFNLPVPLTKSELDLLSTQWKPYRTAAALYLWEALNRNYVDKYQINI